MISYSLILSAIAPVFMIWACGFLVRWRGWIGDETDRFLIRANILFAYPAFILYALLKPSSQEALQDVSLLILAPLSGFLSIALGFVVSWFTGRALGLKVKGGLRTFALSNGIYNYGFIPVPIILIVFPGSGLLGVLFVFTLGVEVAIWTLGMLLLSGKSLSQSWRQMLNPPVIAILLGILLNVTGLAAYTPAFLSKFFEMTGSISVPMALFLGGVAIYDSLNLIKAEPVLRIAASSCVLRLLVIPLLIIAPALLLPLAKPLEQILAIQASMPCGMFAIVLAKHFGGHIQMAVIAIVATSLAGLFTIPAWLPFWFTLLGL